MLQVLLDLQSGKVEVAEVPEPAPGPNLLIVRNRCSVLSPGTERSTLLAARESYVTTARRRPDLVRRVLDTVRHEGLGAAYRKVRSKLEYPQALGYASSGIVEAVGASCEGRFQVGDRVACAGAGVASHAELVAVPANLAATLPADLSFESAAFATLGAIALHTVRQTGPTLGESVAVIGLGLLGQLTVQLLRSAGVRVAAFDLDQALVGRAEAGGAELAVCGGTDEQVRAARAWTRKRGVDAVIVCASSDTDAPMVAAVEMSRDRGRVVVLGRVPFGLPREKAYEKEIELRIARSYGPGRYDRNFEERGVDYPLGYVRWTETRNLEAFLELLASGSVSVTPLVTHRFPLEHAPAAYDLLQRPGKLPPLGVVIEYPDAPRTQQQAPERSVVEQTTLRPSSDELGVGFIGAGSFARSVLLPLFKGRHDVVLRRIVSLRGVSSADARRRFGFDAAGSDAEEILADPAIALVCIATRHDRHAELVVRALKAGKHVFTEKPLALNESDLAEIEAALEDAPEQLLMVGFNRRFAPMARTLAGALRGLGPRTMCYRVNAGPLATDHWLNDPLEGGGRLIGEGCHFIDLLSFLAGDAPIVGVKAIHAGTRAGGSAEDVAVQLSFEDGSIGQLLYTSLGDTALGKERLEVHAGGVSAVIDDFRRGWLWSKGRRRRLGQAGKGHAEEIAATVDAIRQGGRPPIEREMLTSVTRASFVAQRALSEA